MNWDAANVMQTLCEIFGLENVILAGGAVRDWWLGFPIKDYDFFIDGRAVNGVKLDLLKETFPGTVSARADPLKNSDYDDDGIKEVFNCVVGTIDCQFIITHKQPIEYVHDNFDYNICKCYYDPQIEEFIFTEEFNEDLNNKTLTSNYKPIGSMTDYEREVYMNRKIAMDKKFKGWKRVGRVIK